MKGTLIVLDGTDGAGKSTQFRALTDRMTAEEKPFCTVDFPRYGKPSAEMARLYLQGYFGEDPNRVNPYAASSFYAVDRYTSWMEDSWGEHYRDGGLVLSDRYTTANAVHQSPKLPEAEQLDFVEWLFDFESGKLGIPKPDLVVFLDMPTEIALNMLRRREADTHTKGDIHEVDEGYLRACRETALRVARHLGWKVIPCAENGAIRTVEEIHEDVYRVVTEYLNSRI